MFRFKSVIYLPALLLLVFTTFSAAQDPAVVAPDYYKVLLENDYVRVMEFTLPPGKTDGMHSHPYVFAYFMVGSDLEITREDGTSYSGTAEDGNHYWQPPTTHSVKNAGSKTIRVAAFEILSAVGNNIKLKHPPEIAGPDTNKLLVDNEQIRVVETITPPGGGGKLHDHMNMVVYTVSAAKLRITDANGNAREVDVPAGTAMWMEPTTHSVVNIGSEPSHLLHVEIK